MKNQKNPKAFKLGTKGKIGLAAFPSVSVLTAFGRKFGDAFLPRRVRLRLAKTSRQMMSDPKNYEAAGLPVPGASRFAHNLEEWVDKKSWVGRFFNPPSQNTSGVWGSQKINRDYQESSQTD